MKILDWYIIKKFLGTYVFAIALILAITIMFDINEKLDAFLKAPLKATVFDYFLNFLPYFANQFSPLFTFIAVIFFTSKLADNSEIIAMLSTGMSYRRLLRPYMVSATVIAIVTYNTQCLYNPSGQCGANRIHQHLCQEQESRLRYEYSASGGQGGDCIYVAL